MNLKKLMIGAGFTILVLIVLNMAASKFGLTGLKRLLNAA